VGGGGVWRCGRARVGLVVRVGVFVFGARVVGFLLFLPLVVEVVGGWGGGVCGRGGVGVGGWGGGGCECSLVSRVSLWWGGVCVGAGRGGVERGAEKNNVPFSLLLYCSAKIYKQVNK